MILFTKDNLEVNSNVIGMIDKEMNIISLSMDSQNAKKAIFSDALQKIESLKNHTSSPLSSDIVFLENSIKKSIALIDRNLYLLNDLEDSFDDILYMLDSYGIQFSISTPDEFEFDSTKNMC